MISVTLYSRAGCKLCEEAAADLTALQEETPHHLVVIDIDSEPSSRDTYALEIPVVKIGSVTLKWPFTRQDIKSTLAIAVEQYNQSQPQQKKPQ
jgi:hypothetical protein